MTVIVNPGSGPVPEEGEGWTNTEAGAVAEATKWLERMRQEGIGADVVLLADLESAGDGRWRFGFRHTVTGVVVYLDTHGINDMDAYMKGRWAHPRVYWNESSSASPHLENWTAPGFVQTFRPEGEQP